MTPPAGFARPRDARGAFISRHFLSFTTYFLTGCRACRVASSRNYVRAVGSPSPARLSIRRAGFASHRPGRLYRLGFSLSAGFRAAVTREARFFYFISTPGRHRFNNTTRACWLLHRHDRHFRRWNAFGHESPQFLILSLHCIEISKRRALCLRHAPRSRFSFAPFTCRRSEMAMRLSLLKLFKIRQEPKQSCRVGYSRFHQAIGFSFSLLRLRELATRHDYRALMTNSTMACDI